MARPVPGARRYASFPLARGWQPGRDGPLPRRVQFRRDRGSPQHRAPGVLLRRQVVGQAEAHHRGYVRVSRWCYQAAVRAQELRMGAQRETGTRRPEAKRPTVWRGVALRETWDSGAHRRGREGSPLGTREVPFVHRRGRCGWRGVASDTPSARVAPWPSSFHLARRRPTRVDVGSPPRRSTRRGRRRSQRRGSRRRAARVRCSRLRGHVRRPHATRLRPQGDPGRCSTGPAG